MKERGRRPFCTLPPPPNTTPSHLLAMELRHYRTDKRACPVGIIFHISATGIIGIFRSPVMTVPPISHCWRSWLVVGAVAGCTIELSLFSASSRFPLFLDKEALPLALAAVFVARLSFTIRSIRILQSMSLRVQTMASESSCMLVTASNKNTTMTSLHSDKHQTHCNNRRELTCFYCCVLGCRCPHAAVCYCNSCSRSQGNSLTNQSD